MQAFECCRAFLPDGSLLVTELKNGRVTRVHPDGRKETAAEPGGSPNGLAIGPDGALYVCNSGGWDFHEIGDFTIPIPELPAHHAGERVAPLRPVEGDDGHAVGDGERDVAEAHQAFRMAATSSPTCSSVTAYPGK